MTPLSIEADVQATAHYFGVDPALIQAVVVAEGNIIRAVQCSFPNVTTRKEALEITCRTAVHRMFDFIAANGQGRAAFVEFWAKTWAPVGAENDPKGLNANWPRNVLTMWNAATATTPKKV